MNRDPEVRQARLRASLDAAADQSPIADGWDRIRGRVTDQTPEVVISESPDPGPRRRRVALAAALVLAVVGVAGLATVARSDNGDTDSSSVVAGEPASAPTGWYIPADLPDGWTVEGIEVGDGGPRCANRGATWVNDATKSTIVITHDACDVLPGVDPDALPNDDADDEAPLGGSPGGSPRGRDSTEVDLGGITATATSFGPPDARSTRTLTWVDSGTWSARGDSVTAEELIAAANTAVDDPSLDQIPLPGFTPFEQWDVPARGTSPVVQFAIRSPEEVLVSYALEAPGWGTGRSFSPYPTMVDLPGQPLPVIRFTSHDGSWSAAKYAGFWPGADLIGYLFLQDSGAEPPNDVVGELFASLRPATTEEWRAFLASAGDHDTALDEAPTLDDVQPG